MWDGLLELIKSTGPSVVTVFGWYQVHKLTSARDIRSEKRKRAIDRLDKLVDECLKIRERAINYHTSLRDPVLELELKANFADLGLGIPLLTSFGVSQVNIDGCVNYVIRFKRATQFSHFEDDHNSPLNANDRFLIEIAGASSALIRSIRACQSSLLNDEPEK